MAEQRRLAGATASDVRTVLLLLALGGARGLAGASAAARLRALGAVSAQLADRCHVDHEPVANVTADHPVIRRVDVPG